MDQAMAQEHLLAIKDHNAKIRESADWSDTEVDALLASMEGGEPVPPGTDPDPPETQHIYLDPIWKGAIGSGNRRVVEGDKCEWKGKCPQWSENTDYVNPKLWAVNEDGQSVIGDRIPVNVRLFNPIFEGITCAEHFFYINHGWPEERNEIGFVIFGGYSRKVKAKKTWAEFKACKALIEGHTIEDDCEFAQYVRWRHGNRLVMAGGRGKGEIATRGWAHHIDVPGAYGQFWSGNLPAKSKLWIPEKEKGGGNYQRSEVCFAGKSLKKLIVGEKSTDQDDYPALDNLYHPSLKERLELGNEKGTEPGELTWRELWKKNGLL